MSFYRLNTSQSLIIDLIRVLSAQGVLVGHLLFWPGFLNKEKFGFLFGLASYCVIVFFILSGFLICLSILNRPNYGFKNFFIDRFARIYTPYIPALILVFVLDYLVAALNGKEFFFMLYAKEFIGNILMLQEFPPFELAHKLTGSDLFYLPYLGSNLPLWTLSIEWWLYMVFGWIMLVPSYKKGLKLILLAILSIVPLYQLFIGSHMGPGIVIYWFLGSLFPALLVAFKNYTSKFSKIHLPLLIIGGLGFMFDFFAGAFIFLFGFFLALKYYETHTLKISSVIAAIIKRFADFSFSLYLIHYTLITTLFSLIPVLHNYGFCLKFTIAIAFANFSSFIFGNFTEAHYKTAGNYIKAKFL